MVKRIGGGLLFLIAALLIWSAFGLLRSNLEANYQEEVWLPLPEIEGGAVTDGDRTYHIRTSTRPSGQVEVHVSGWLRCVATPDTNQGWLVEIPDQPVSFPGCRARGGALEIGPFGPGVEVHQGPPPLPPAPGPTA